MYRYGTFAQLVSIKTIESSGGKLNGLIRNGERLKCYSRRKYLLP